MNSSFDILAKQLSKKYEWLESITSELNIDKLLKDFICGLDINDSEAYLPTRHYRLLGDVSNLLDRVLSYRREYLELSGSAIKQALEYDAFEAQSSTAEALDLACWAKVIRDEEAKGQKMVSAAFEEITPGNNLAKGFQIAAEASIQVSIAARSGEEQRERLVLQRWSIAKKYQSDLQLRHYQKGHPLNFSERALKVLELMKEDLTQAVLKAHAAAKGIKLTYDLDFKESWLEGKSTSPVDEFVLSTRKIIREIDILEQQESEFQFSAEVPVTKDFEWVDLTKLSREAFEGPSRFIRARSLAAIIVLKDTAKSKRTNSYVCNVQVQTESGLIVTLYGARNRWPEAQDWYYGEELLEMNVRLAQIRNNQLFVDWKLSILPLESPSLNDINISDIASIKIIISAICHRYQKNPQKL